MSPSSSSEVTCQVPYYSEDTNFAALAKEDADFATVYNAGDGFLDWQDPQTLKQLTQSVLKRDFSLNLSLPDDRLCPPVPVRWNYIRWIQDLLDTTGETYTDRYDPEREVIGLDIGAGASCIYGLLACATRPQWRMAVTDVDEHSLDYARRNVEANGLKDRIRLAQTTTDAPLILLDAMKLETLDFVMCNPPFYSSHDDMLASYGSKSKPPSAVCTGSESEMICPGGDVGFVIRILEESLKLRERVQWYTSMLGRLASVHQIVAKLKVNGITNFAITNLKAGQKTRRWAVAWSFQDWRPSNEVARHGELVHAILPAPTEWTIAVPLMRAASAGEKVDATMKALDLKWQWRPVMRIGVAFAKENVWSRAARRKKKFQTQEMENGKGAVSEDSEEEEDAVALAVKVTCGEEKVNVRWLRGGDSVLFESFCGMLKRELGMRNHDRPKRV